MGRSEKPNMFDAQDGLRASEGFAVCGAKNSSTWEKTRWLEVPQPPGFDASQTDWGSTK